MRLNELNSYLADPTRLSPETLPAVRQLYESYPYCGVFAFLYLYNLARRGCALPLRATSLGGAPAG